MGQDPIEKLLTWKDLALMSMGFTFPAGIFGLPPLIAAAVSCIIFGISYLDPSVANPKNKKERKAAFIASLVIGVLVGYASTIVVGSLAAVIPPHIKLVVVGISVMAFTSYGSKLGWWSLKTGPLNWFPNKWLNWRDLFLLTMALTFPLAIFDRGVANIVGALVAMLFYAVLNIFKDNFDKKVSFITSLVAGLIASLYILSKTISDPAFASPVFAIALSFFINYMSIGFGVPITGPLKSFPDKWLNWRDVFLMTMALTFPLAIFDSGMATIWGAIIATIFYAITIKFKNNFNKKTSFITSLVAGIVAALGILTKTYNLTGITFASPVFVIALSFFINYMSIAFDVPIAGGLITLLFSILPALAVGKNIGLNMLISTVVSMGVYILLVKDAKNKRQEWMWPQSAYIGMLIGSSVAIFTKGLAPEDLIGKAKDLIGAGVPSMDSVSEVVSPINLVTSYLWVIYLVIWILTQAKAPMPYKWNTLFNVK